MRTQTTINLLNDIHSRPDDVKRWVAHGGHNLELWRDLKSKGFTASEHGKMFVTPEGYQFLDRR